MPQPCLWNICAVCLLKPVVVVVSSAPAVTLWVGTFLQWHSLGKSDRTDSGMNSSWTLSKHVEPHQQGLGTHFYAAGGCIAKMKELDLAEVQGGGLDTSINALVYFVSSFPKETKANRAHKRGAASLPYPHAMGPTGCWEVSSGCKKTWGTSPSSAISKDSGTTRGKVWELLQNKKISF